MPTVFKIPVSLKDLEIVQGDSTQLYIPEDEIDDTLFSSSSAAITRHLTDIQNRCVATERPYAMVEDTDLVFTIYTFLKLWDEIKENDDKDSFVDLMLSVLNKLISSIDDIKVAILEDSPEGKNTRLQLQNTLKMVIYFTCVLMLRLSEDDNALWAEKIGKFKNKTATKKAMQEDGLDNLYGGKRDSITQSVLDLIEEHWPTVRHSFRNQVDKSFNDALIKIGITSMESVIRMDEKTVREGLFLYTTKVARICEPFSDELGRWIFDRVLQSETLSTFLPHFIHHLVRDEGREEGGVLVKDIADACVKYESTSSGAKDTSTATKNCQTFLEECALCCPAIYIPHLEMLQKNLLDFEHANIRMATLNVLRAISVDVLGQKTDEISQTTRERVLDSIEERLHDVNGHTRARALACWELLVETRRAPLTFLSRIIDLAIKRLRDQSAQVRRHAVTFLIAAINNNPFGKVLQRERFMARLEQVNNILMYNFRTMTNEEIEQHESERNICEHAIPFIDKMSRAVEAVYPMLEATSSIDVQAAIKFATCACMYGLDSSFKGMRTYFKLVWGATGSDMVFKTMIDCFADFFLSIPINSKDAAILAALTLLKMLALCSEEDMVSLREVIRVCHMQGQWKEEITIALFELFQMKYPDVRNVEMSASLAVVMLEMLASANAEIVRDSQKTYFRVLKENYQHFGLTCLNIFQTLHHLRDSDEPPPFEPDHKWMKLIQVVLNDRTFLISDWLAIAQKGISLIYHLCTRPDDVMNGLYFKLSQTFHADRSDWVALTKLVFMLGEGALCDLVALENAHKREIAEMRKKYREESGNADGAGKKGGKKGKAKKKTKKSTKKSKSNTSTPQSPTNRDQLEKELGMGGEEMDTAEIDQRYKQLKQTIFQRKDQYSRLIPIVEQATSPTVEKVLLRKVAVTTQAKLCVVSRDYCKRNLLAVVTVMANPTAPPDVRCNLIALMADIISIHTNDAEGYTSYLFQCLNDEKLVVRKDAMLAVTHLVLNGMLMVSSNIGYLARRVVDTDEFISHSAKSFFYHFHHKHSEKYNPIYNHTPDCISTLSALSEKELPYSEFCKIMRFLFSFIRKDTLIKSMTNTLTNRFAIVGTDDPHKIRKWKCIAYCLTLMKLQKQAFLVLMDNYNSYKHVLPESVDIKNMFLDMIRSHKRTLTTAKDVAAYKEQLTKFEESIVNVVEKEGEDDEYEEDEELQQLATEGPDGVNGEVEEGKDEQPKRRRRSRKRKSETDHVDAPSTKRRRKRQKKDESDDEIDFEDGHDAAQEEDEIDFEDDTETVAAPIVEPSPPIRRKRRKSRLSVVKPEPQSDDDDATSFATDRLSESALRRAKEEHMEDSD